MNTAVCLPEVVAKRPETLEEYFSQSGFKPITNDEIRELKKQGEDALRSQLPAKQKLLWVLRPTVYRVKPILEVLGCSLFVLCEIGFVVGLLSFVACLGLSMFGLAGAYIPTISTVGLVALAAGCACFFGIKLLIGFYSMQVWDRWEEVDISTAWTLLPAGFPADISFLVNELSTLQGVTLTCEILGADPGLWASSGDKKVCVAWWNGDDVQIGSRL